MKKKITAIMIGMAVMLPMASGFATTQQQKKECHTCQKDTCCQKKGCAKEDSLTQKKDCCAKTDSLKEKKTRWLMMNGSYVEPTKEEKDKDKKNGSSIIKKY